MAQTTSSSTSPAVISLTNRPKDGQMQGAGDSLWMLALRRIRRDHLTLIALSALLLLAVFSMSAPILANLMQIDPDKTSENAFLPPLTGNHILGTDDIGRDHFIRVLYAGQVTLGVAFLATLLSIVLGIGLGVWSGYMGGIIDDVMNWLVTTLDSIPFFYLLLLISALFKPTPATFVLIFGLFGWTGTMRLVRGETFSLREREFIVAARSIGVRPLRIMFTHIVPNVISVIIVTLALNVGGLILTESALSYLGVGIKHPAASWGYMLVDAKNYYTRGPHLVFAPGILISLTVLCTFIIGDGLRDAFDPKLKEG
jgi:peptide/nickel transport system permease protein